MDHIFGYTPFIDVSARGLPGGFFLGKSWHTFAPLGPVLVTADEVPEPNRLQVQLSVNGTQRQEYSTSDMGRPVPHLLADLTNVLTLEPGDVVATGTPGGVGVARGKFLVAGDVVRIEIEQIGAIENRVVEEPQDVDRI